MESRLEDLTRRLYEQGLERGRQEAATVLDKAKEDASTLLDQAREEARTIREEARREADALHARSLGEIRVAGGQAIQALRQEVAYLLSRSSLQQDVSETLGNGESLLRLMEEAVRAAASCSGEARGMGMELPESAREGLEKLARSRLKDQLANGLELRFDGRFEHGFRISPREGTYHISFTDADFLSFFQGYLRSRTREILFPGD